MTNLLQQAISCDDPNRAAKIIWTALGIESNEVLPPDVVPGDRELRARIIGEWLKTEAHYLA